MKLIKLYVGHDNKTQKRFSEELIKSLVGKYFNGFTIIKTNGVWKTASEESYIIELITDEAEKVNKLKSDLVTKLNQDSILLTRTNLNTIEF